MVERGRWWEAGREGGRVEMMLAEERESDENGARRGEEVEMRFDVNECWNDDSQCFF